MPSLQELYQQSIDHPEEFWGEAAKSIDWIKEWDQVLDVSRAPHFYQWFKGALCNSCYNALDRHVIGGNGGRTALIWDSPVSNSKKQYSYQELLDQVAVIAGGLARLGVSKGDRVIVYMPMIPEAIMTILACARLGAIHSVVFGGFAANELAVRIKDSTPKVIVTSSCGVEPNRIVPYQPMIEGALDIASGIVEHCVVFQREIQKSDFSDKHGTTKIHDWHAFIQDVDAHPPVPVAATDPLYILYTSGTTGEPKGVIRDNGGHMVALNWSMPGIYDIHPGDVFWSASDIGWVVGHSYIIYAPLFAGATTLVYEGKPVGTPDAGAFWRMISEYKVKSLFTAPTAFRAIKKEDPQGEFIGKYDLSSFKSLFLAGERCDPDTLEWARQKLNIPVIDHWWQTETGWSIAANCMGFEPLPIKPGSPTKPVPGYDLKILDEDNQVLGAGEMGDICIKLPLPPSCLPSLWNADARFISSYLEKHPGFYDTGDAGYIDEDGYVFVMSRTDDIINVAGHRLSTGAIEEVLANHQEVAECAVIGVKDALKGELPFGFIVLKSGITRDEAEIEKQLIKMVRESIGPVAAFKTAIKIDRLPKTRSGKILRGIMRRIANGEAYKPPATIDDPAILDEVTAALKRRGYPID